VQSHLSRLRGLDPERLDRCAYRDVRPQRRERLEPLSLGSAGQGYVNNGATAHNRPEAVIQRVFFSLHIVFNVGMSGARSTLRCSWRCAVLTGLVIEAFIVGFIALAASRVIPLGDTSIRATAAWLHLPGLFLVFPVWRLAVLLGVPLLVGIALAVIVVVAVQVAFFAAATMGITRICAAYPRQATIGTLLLLVAVYAAILLRPMPYPPGMDSNEDRVVSLEEWTRFHAATPRFYGGYDASGRIPRDALQYYEWEFRRVDCNRDAVMDDYEHGQLHWNMRWCGSWPRHVRPWWR
jgi:hypothetical protein